MFTKTDRTWPRWAEALLVALVGYLSVQEAYVRADGHWLAWEAALALAATAAVALRGRFLPLAAAVTVATAAVLGIVPPLLVVLFRTARRGRLVPALLCAAAALAGNRLADPGRNLWTLHLYGPFMPLALALALGLWAGSHRRLVAALDDQVERLRVERGLRAEQARLAERARIAAEMHDVLAHRLTVLALHAGALRRRAAGLPEPVAERLDLLRTTSTEALADLRDVLGALRHTEDGPDAADRREPGLRELSELLAEARAAGQTVEADLAGDAESVPVSHRLAVHRVVQEALTNARKHAAGAPARVTVRYGTAESAVDVRNDAGTPSEAADFGSGYGLIGLTERVTALGGRLEYGPSDRGGWRMTATLPGTGRQAAAHTGAASAGTGPAGAARAGTGPAGTGDTGAA
ncbi:sensor histidine kinase [Streptomyces huiliensis]|uniref:sensor histidine kinase n=1 Tax=Streptomyces huiliensis TaxID=2876027 RepID=UPI001CBC03DD|nr:histidine kinase [Streptomyces huiliensis]MBZ4324005.1 two-component sensor histidine kinase [Streptomyces huiliensis]